MTLLQRPKPAMFFVLVILGIIFLVLTSGLLVQAQSTAVAVPLFVPLSASAAADLPANPTDLPASRTQYVTLNMASFDGGQAGTIALNLFDGEMLTAVQTRTDQYNNGSTVWVGQLPEQPNSDVSLSMINGQIVGTINTGEQLYSVRPLGGASNIHALQELEPEFLPGLPPLVPDIDAAAVAHAALHDHDEDYTVVPLGNLPEPDTAPGGATAANDDGSVVDALVVYTPAVRQKMGGTAATEALIALAMSESNTGYDSSLVNFDLRLAHSTEVAYNEVGDFTTDLERVTYFDGYIDEVLTLRDQYKADVVVLLIDGQAFCGLAWLKASDNPAYEGLAFSVTAYNCATGYYSFGHEIGHNMGSAHDRNNSNGVALFNYGFGYQDPTNAFRTIMAYNCPGGGCVRVNRWSNPNVGYGGRPTGIDQFAQNSAYNALSLNNAAYSVANYRQGTQPTPTPTNTPTPTPTNTPTPTPTPTPLPTVKVTLQPDQSGTYDLGNIEVGFPTGVFTDDVELILEALDPDTPLSDLPEGLEASKYQMRITAVYVSTGLPAQPQPGQQYLIGVTYDDAGRNLLKEPTLGLYRWAPQTSEWVLEATSVLNMNTQTVRASGSELTTWAVLGEGPERLFLPITSRP